MILEGVGCLNAKIRIRRQSDFYQCVTGSTSESLNLKLLAFLNGITSLAISLSHVIFSIRKRRRITHNRKIKRHLKAEVDYKRQISPPILINRITIKESTPIPNSS